MTDYQEVMERLQVLPEPLMREVKDFVDFLLSRYGRGAETSLDEITLAESDLSDYLHNLEDYEERLARGEIRW